MNREVRELIDVMTQMDLTDIYRLFHPNRKEYTFFSAPHGIFSKIDHILGNKTNLSRYKKIEITPCTLSDHCGLKQNSTAIQIQRAHKYMDIKQCSAESSMGQGKNKGRN